MRGGLRKKGREAKRESGTKKEVENKAERQ